MQEVLRRSGAYVLALLLVLLTILGAYELQAPPSSHLIIDQVTLETGETVSLPYSWDGPVKTTRVVEFEASFKSTGLGTDPQLYLPYFDQGVEIDLNGFRLLEDLPGVRWQSPLTSDFALYPLPAAWLVEGDNRLRIMVTTGPTKFGSLAEIHLGKADDFSFAYHLRMFVLDGLRPIVLGVQLLLTMACVTLTLMLPRKQSYRFLSICLMCASIISFSYFSEYFPVFAPLIPWLMLMSVPAGFAFLGFALTLHHVTLGRKTITIATVLSFTPFVLAAYGSLTMSTLVLWISMPICLLSFVVATLILTLEFLKRPAVDLALLTSGAVITAIAICHDVLALLGYLPLGAYLALPTRIVVLIGCALFLILRMVRTTKASENAGIFLKAQLAAKEAELQAIFTEQRADAEAKATLAERSRIVSELHDGVASYMSTVIALADQKDGQIAEIQTVARYALAELRILIDALGPDVRDLHQALAVFRDCSVDPLERLEIGVNWSMKGLPEIEWMATDQILSVLRILQEALSNSVRHGKPTSIRIIGAVAGGGKEASLVIENAGGQRFEQTTAGFGYGMKTMAQRAEEIGGRIILEPLSTGAVFTLVLPISKDVSAQEACGL